MIDQTVKQVFAQRELMILDHLIRTVKIANKRLHTEGVTLAFTEIDTEYGVIQHVMNYHQHTMNPDIFAYLATLYQFLNGYFNQRGRVTDALEWGENILHLLRYRDFHADFKLFAVIGDAYQSAGKYDEAMHYYYLMIETLENVRNSDKDLSPLYNGLGICLWRANMLEEARYYLHKSLEIDSAFGDDRGMAHTLMNLAHISATYWTLEGMQEALSLSKEAVDLVRPLNDPALLAKMLATYAEKHVSALQLDEAGDVYEEAMALQHSVGDKVGFAVTQFNYALWLRIFQRYDEAIQIAEQAYQTLKYYDAPGYQNIAHNLAQWKKTHSE